MSNEVVLQAALDYIKQSFRVFPVKSDKKPLTAHGLKDATQKQGATFGRGQEFGLEKLKLYLSMDKGKIRIVKGKSWAIKNVDPNDLQVSFKIVAGCQFQATSKWDWVK